MTGANVTCDTLPEATLPARQRRPNGLPSPQPAHAIVMRSTSLGEISSSLVDHLHTCDSDQRALDLALLGRSY